jgi:hypothetical protein
MKALLTLGVSALLLAGQTVAAEPVKPTLPAASVGLRITAPSASMVFWVTKVWVENAVWLLTMRSDMRFPRW